MLSPSAKWSERNNKTNCKKILTRDTQKDYNTNQYKQDGCNGLSASLNIETNKILINYNICKRFMLDLTSRHTTGLIVFDAHTHRP